MCVFMYLIDFDHFVQVSHCNKMPSELREQQNNQLGKTFMPYTQSNYRWVSSDVCVLNAVIYPLCSRSACTRAGGLTASQAGSRPWTRSRASSAETPGTSQTSVPRVTSPSSATTTTKSEVKKTTDQGITRREKQFWEKIMKIHSECL